MSVNTKPSGVAGLSLSGMFGYVEAEKAARYVIEQCVAQGDSWEAVVDVRRCVDIGLGVGVAELIYSGCLDKPDVGIASPLGLYTPSELFVKRVAGKE